MPVSETVEPFSGDTMPHDYAKPLIHIPVPCRRPFGHRKKK